MFSDLGTRAKNGAALNTSNSDPLDDVALVDAKRAAATGSASLSWWYAEIAAGRAPKPVVSGSRMARWRLSEVREFWRTFAERGADAAGKTAARAAKASAAAKAKRQAKGVA